MPLKTIAIVITAITLCHGKPQAHSADELSQRIQSGNTAAIYEAGRSGDSTLLPTLREELKKSRDDSERDALKLALGKLGDEHQLQQMYCRARKSWGLDLDKFTIEYIGGGFWIRTLAMTFDFDAHVEKMKQPQDSDLRYGLPSWFAMQELAYIVPNPPVKQDVFPTNEEHDAALQIWKVWIATHQQDIDKLQPNGKGVIFSEEGCHKLR